MTHLAWVIFIGAAILEVGGDAVVRKWIGEGLPPSLPIHYMTKLLKINLNITIMVYAKKA